MRKRKLIPTPRPKKKIALNVKILKDFEVRHHCHILLITVTIVFFLSNGKYAAELKQRLNWSEK